MKTGDLVYWVHRPEDAPLIYLGCYLAHAGVMVTVVSRSGRIVLFWARELRMFLP